MGMYVYYATQPATMNAVLISLLVTALAAQQPPVRPPLAEGHLLTEDVLFDGVATEDDPDWYFFVVSDQRHEITISTGSDDVLLRLFNDDTGHETAAVATVDTPIAVSAEPGRYRLSVETGACARYELIRTRMEDSVLASDHPAVSSAASPAPQWPEREVPELIRGAGGVLGSVYDMPERSYHLTVARGYRAQVVARCHEGWFDVTIRNASHRISTLLQPGHEKNSRLLPAGEYVLDVTGVSPASQFSFDVRMIRVATPEER